MNAKVLRTLLLISVVAIMAAPDSRAEPEAMPAGQTHEMLHATPAATDAAGDAMQADEDTGVGGAHDHAAEGAEHHASAGLPQMDTSWFPSQIFWLALTFVCLYFIFSKKLLPEISGTIENRRSQIQGDLDSAQSLRNEAEKVQHSYEEILGEARDKSTALFATVDEEMKRKVAKKTESFHLNSQKKTAETEKSIEETKAQAMSEMQTIAAEVASAAAEKIIGVSTDIDQAKTLVKNIGRKAA